MSRRAALSSRSMPGSVPPTGHLYVNRVGNRGSGTPAGSMRAAAEELRAQIRTESEQVAAEERGEPLIRAERVEERIDADRGRHHAGARATREHGHRLIAVAKRGVPEPERHRRQRRLRLDRKSTRLN